MRVLLYRAFLDTSTGGYYSPLHMLLKCATLIPPEEFPLTPYRLEKIPPWLNPFKVRDPCTGMPLNKFLPLDRKWVLRNNPRLDLGFLTDRPIARGGKIPWGITKDSLILFISGLAEYPEDFWETPRRLVEIRRAFRESLHNCKASLYAVGGLIVEKFIDVLNYGWKRIVNKYPCLKESPDYWYNDPEVVAILGKPFRLRPPIKLYTPCNWKVSQALIDLLGKKRAQKVASTVFKKLNPFDLGDPIDVLERYSKVEILKGECL
jgi:hypothetical protein